MVSLAQDNTLRNGTFFCQVFLLKIIFSSKFRLNSDDPMMATQALQYNNITVSKNEFLRYSVTVTVLQFLKSKTALMSLTRPSDILFLCSWPTLFFGVGIDYLSDVTLIDKLMQYNRDSHINNVDDVPHFGIK